MRRTLRVLTIAAGIVFALCTVALIALNLYVQSVGAQAQIQQELSQKLGLPVRIGSISITPWGGLTLRGISIADGAHTEGVDFIAAKSFELHAAISSLLSGNLVIRKVALVSPSVTWPQDENGRWRLPVATAKSEPSPGASSPAAAESPTVAEAGPVPSAEAVETPVGPAPSQTQAPQPSTALEPVAPKVVRHITPDVQRVAIRDGTFRFLDHHNVLVAAFEGVDLQANVRDQVSLHGVVHIDRLSAHDRFFLQNIRSPVKYAPDSFELPRISGRAAGGEVNGSLALQPQSEKSPFHATVHFRGLKADDIVSDAGGGRGVLTGQLEGNLDLSGRTAELNDLSGMGDIVLHDGQLQQYSVLVALGQILQIEELTQLYLDQAEAKYHISDGSVNIDALTLRSPNLRLSATGAINFNGKLHLNAELAINEKVRSQLFRAIRENFQPTTEPGYSAIDFQISGTLDRPRTNLVEQVVGQNLRDLVNGFLGGKKQDKKKHPSRDGATPPDGSSSPAESPTPAPSVSPTP